MQTKTSCHRRTIVLPSPLPSCSFPPAHTCCYYFATLQNKLILKQCDVIYFPIRHNHAAHQEAVDQGRSHVFSMREMNERVEAIYILQKCKTYMYSINKYIENSFYNVCRCTLHTHSDPYCTTQFTIYIFISLPDFTLMTCTEWNQTGF